MPAASLPDLSTPLAAALAYARRGWPVCPLHEPTTDGCTCGKGDCLSPGKHPRTAHGLKDATTTEKVIRQWWSRWPSANVAVVTGERSGLVVVDVDPRKGGSDTWDALMQEHDSDEPTYTVTTGGGGLHVYYQRPPAPILKSKSDAIPPGVDCKAEGGYVVAPPSAHSSGARYVVRLDCDVQAIPAWLLSLLPKTATPTPRVVSLPSPAEAVDRCRKYVAKCDAAVSGQGGHTTTLLVARAIVRGFDLHGSTARSILEEYNARCDPPWSDRELDHKLAEAEKCDKPLGYLLNSPPPDRGVPHEAPPTDSDIPGDWEVALERDDKGRIVKSLPNLIHILSYHPAWRGVLGRNLFTGKDVFLREAPWYPEDKPAETRTDLDDSDDARVLAWLCRVYGPFKVETIRQAIDIVCSRYAVHPVRDYLCGLRWDGTERLPTFADRYLGAEDDPHARVAPMRWMIAAVRRIFEPGCQSDSILVLEGRQGAGKSSCFRALASDEWFADSIGDLANKDSADGLRGKWIVEVAELKWHKADEETRKAFLSRRFDHYRPSYGRRTIDVARQCVFGGTTNEDSWQTDATGARRYWAVACRAIDVPAITRDRDQLWAEAVTRYRRGEPSFLQPAEVEAQISALENRREIDVWEQKILDWIDGRTVFAVSEVLRDCLSIATEHQNQSHQRRVNAVLRAAGLVRQRGQAPRGYPRPWLWSRP